MQDIDDTFLFPNILVKIILNTLFTFKVECATTMCSFFIVAQEQHRQQTDPSTKS